MKLKILSLLGSLVYAVSMHGMHGTHGNAQFKAMLRDYTKGAATAQAVVDAYDNFKQKIDIELAKQALKVILGTTIEALREKANKPAAAHYRNMAPSKKEKAAQSQRNKSKAQQIANEREKARLEKKQEKPAQPAQEVEKKDDPVVQQDTILVEQPIQIPAPQPAAKIEVQAQPIIQAPIAQRSAQEQERRAVQLAAQLAREAQQVKAHASIQQNVPVQQPNGQDAAERRAIQIAAQQAREAQQAKVQVPIVQQPQAQVQAAPQIAAQPGQDINALLEQLAKERAERKVKIDQAIERIAKEKN